MPDTAFPWLFLDASGVTARTGVWQNSCWLGWQEGAAPALESLFAGTRAALAAAQTPWPELGGYLYVDGPGSVLGLRLAAMAIRAWQADDAARSQGEARPVYSAGSLPLAAALALAAGEKPPFTLFTDAKQGFWQIFEVASAEPEKYCAGAPREIPEAALPAGTLFHLPARKAWQRAPERARALPVSLREHPEILALRHLFRKVETPAPYSAHRPEYKKWTGAAK